MGKCVVELINEKGCVQGRVFDTFSNELLMYADNLAKDRHGMYRLVVSEVVGEDRVVISDFIVYGERGE